MSHLTDRSGSPHHLPTPHTERPVGRGAALRAVCRPLLGGAVAAGLGLGACAVLVLVPWVGSPYAEDGPGGALHLAAALWLLAHGVALTRTGTLTGAPTPYDLTPLLLLALPVWLLYRTTRLAVGEASPPAPFSARISPVSARVPARAPGVPAAVGVGTGYLLVAVAATYHASNGVIRAQPESVSLHLPVMILAVTAVAVWRSGVGSIPGVTRGSRAVERLARTGPVAGMGVGSVLRAALLGGAVLTGGGTVLTVTAVAWHGPAAVSALDQLSADWSGDVAVLLLTLAFLPNAAVWATSYGLGSGFTLGAGSQFTPLAATAPPQLPHFPLLAAVPAEGPGTALTRTTCLLPLAAGLAMGCYLAREAAPVSAPVPRGAPHEEIADVRATATGALLAACGCGALLAVLAALAGGSLGDGELAHVGPRWPITGVAALSWTAAVATPTALAVRSWRLRKPGMIRIRTRRPNRGSAGTDGSPPAADPRTSPERTG